MHERLLFNQHKIDVEHPGEKMAEKEVRALGEEFLSPETQRQSDKITISSRCLTYAIPWHNNVQHVCVLRARCGFLTVTAADSSLIWLLRSRGELLRVFNVMVLPELEAMRYR